MTNSGEITTTSTYDTNNILSESLRLVKLGYYVAPVKVWLDDSGKKRMSRLPWSRMSTNSAATVTEWFGDNGKYRGHDVLIDCAKSGIVVVDLDQSDGKDGVARWREVHGPTSHTVALTRSGGWHGYYRADPQRPIRNSSSEIAPGIDVRGVGGMVFAPPTVVGNEGGAYTWVSGPQPVAELTPVPADLLTLHSDQATHRVATGEAVVLSRGAADKVLHDAQEGMLCAVEGENWNSALNTLGYVTGRWCATLGETEDDAYERVTYVTSQRVDAKDGLDEESERTAWRSIRQGIAQPWELREVEDLIDWDGREDDPKDEPNPVSLEDEFLSPADVKLIPPPAYLVQSIVPAQGLIHLFGASGSYKSFAMLSLAAEIGAGTPWFAYETKQAECWIVVAEGVTGTGKRIEAWERHHGREMQGVKFLPRPLQLLGREMRALTDLARQRKPGLIVFDTQARVTVGVQENDAKEMGEVIHAAEKLREASGGAVMLVHHTGHVEGRSRGSSSVKGALATEVAVTRKDKGNAVTIDVLKQKDDAEVTGIELTAISVEIGEDEYGLPVSSLVLVSGTGPDVRVDPEQPPEDTDLGSDIEQRAALGGRGSGVLTSAARYMAHNAIGGAGRSRSEVCKWLGLKPDNGAMRAAWDSLIELGAIKPDGGSGKTGRCHWVPQEDRHV